MIDEIHNLAIYRLISQPQQKMKKKKNQGTTKEGQGRAGESGNQDGSNRHHLDPSMDSLTRAMGKIQKWLRCN